VGSDRRPAIKICGVTMVKDARWLATLPIQAIGLNFHPGSPRRVSIEEAREIVSFLPKSIEKVGVFVDRPIEEVLRVAAEVGLDAIQLHGDEPAEYVRQTGPIPVIKAFRLKGPAMLPGVDAFTQSLRKAGRENLRLLFDAYHPAEAGGTGLAWDWRQLGSWRPGVKWLLAGGLKPTNAREAIELLHPDGIDLASGVESAPGVKDRSKVEELIREVELADGTKHQPADPSGNTSVDG
jgi:phosphoribosylanthranilate isomerase